MDVRQEEIINDLIAATRKLLVIDTPGQYKWIKDGLAKGSHYWAAQVLIYEALEEWDRVQETIKAEGE